MDPSRYLLLWDTEHGKQPPREDGRAPQSFAGPTASNPLPQRMASMSVSSKADYRGMQHQFYDIGNDGCVCVFWLFVMDVFLN